MNNLSISTTTKLINSFLNRFHAIIFAVVVLGGLSFAVLILNNIVTISTTEGSQVDGSSGETFDQETIDRLNKLETSENSENDLIFPEGRINPFIDQ